VNSRALYIYIYIHTHTHAYIYWSCFGSITRPEEPYWVPLLGCVIAEPHRKGLGPIALSGLMAWQPYICTKQRRFADQKKVDQGVNIRVRKWTEKKSPNVRVEVLMLSKPGSIRPPMKQNLAEKQTHNWSLLHFGPQGKSKEFSKEG